MGGEGGGDRVEGMGGCLWLLSSGSPCSPVAGTICPGGSDVHCISFTVKGRGTVLRGRVMSSLVCLQSRHLTAFKLVLP